jgi:imidazolonepropionase-like amidohydrolase
MNRYLPKKREENMMHAIKAGTLIDGHGGDLIKDAVMLIEGSTITAVGPASLINIPAGAKITDASDKTVMPGLIDNHVHVMFTSASMEQQLFTPKAVSYYQAAENLERTLRAGFTTRRIYNRPRCGRGRCRHPPGA